MELPRGMRDFESAESAGIEMVRAEFLRTSALYGFSYVDPSPLELLSTLETRSGPAIRDEIYHFEDKGGRAVALRFDFTMGLARRAASRRSERLPSKISSFGGVFRYDEPQKGRYRYFHQWDIEIFGRPTVEADAEIIEVTSRLLERLGLQNVSIDVCHRSLVEQKIREIFDDPTDGSTADMLRAIDKTTKKTRAQILDEFQRYPAEKLEQVMDFASIRGSISEVADKTDVSRLEAWDYLTRLFDSLESRGVENARLNMGIVRGLDYYSGMVFEAFVEGSTVGALAGGGRYDALTEAFGRGDLGAAGVAGGVERTMLAMHEQNLIHSDDTVAAGPGRRVAVLCATLDSQKLAASIASSLRRAGIAADTDLGDKNLKKQLSDAAHRRASLVVMVGLHELAVGEAVLRDMESGKESRIRLDALRDDPHGIICG